LTRSGDVTREYGDSVHLVAAEHRMRDAIVIENGVLLLDPDVDDASPLATFQKARHGPLDEVASVAGRVFHKIHQRPPDDLLKRRPDEIGETPVDGADFAFQCERKQNVVERIDQVAVTLLGALDDRE